MILTKKDRKEELTMKFHEMFRELRENRKSTLKNIADAIGKSVVYISDVENGRRSPFKEEDIYKIADVLNTDPIPLIDAARLSKKRLELDLDLPSQTADFHNMALTLARGWAHYTNEDVKKISEILDEINKKIEKGVKHHATKK
ncbi:helix-turn-helix domain-containing protein [Leptospira bouyouniensis]|uniref:helix-turn-helix domain-containing protein n=1 Tax=Leptospira bouyouniensis TaxID=2484911 RepID=UPI0010910D71|nr:helix-turn-helix transcriptional regulator [Leptospira bouyouniensis]TGM88275.1 XRE family transcriptional regulator [Leptospira bouyouniensis]